MNYIHVILGLVSGAVYSILGYLKNTVREFELDPKEIAEKILNEKRELDKIEKVISLVSLVLWSRVYGEKLYFNWREFSKTVIHGLAVGFLMGILDLPLDSSISLISQIGLITTTRKATAIITNTTKKTIRFSKR